MLVALAAPLELCYLITVEIKPLDFDRALIHDYARYTLLHVPTELSALPDQLLPTTHGTQYPAARCGVLSNPVHSAKHGTAKPSPNQDKTVTYGVAMVDREAPSPGATEVVTGGRRPAAEAG